MNKKEKNQIIPKFFLSANSLAKCVQRFIAKYRPNSSQVHTQYSQAPLHSSTTSLASIYYLLLNSIYNTLVHIQSLKPSFLGFKSLNIHLHNKITNRIAMEYHKNFKKTLLISSFGCNHLVHQTIIKSSKHKYFNKHLE